ncbi:tetratricopeptide repeat protein [Wenzhouxiangella sp. XN79A]|uniref:tetratricopeptide repeat protein n=1 Tax=Wenzhouxiangella sp. XN79A TaxID=2724193 RepID=UPI00144A8944|nr:tetratricopeptide repeat protein [Wenzhouxiangella sp. XN79A]NKI34588.1 tetratricopeptide repeat protein [Wenzhouxiangella sp. XN79A]
MSAPEPDLSRQAAKLFSDGRYNEAERLFERIVEAEPENWQALMMLGLCRRALNKYEAALKSLSRAAELGDGSAAAHYYHGRLLAELGREDEAREALAQAVALDPNHVEARTMMGVMSIHRGDLTRAISELRVALRARADHVPALAALGRALVQAGQVDEAHSLASQAVKLDPDHPSAQDAMARVYLAQGHVDFAEQALRNALKKAPDSGELHGGLAAVLRTKGQDREALTHYREAIRRNYGGASSVLGAVTCLTRLGDQQQAWQLLEQAREKWPTDRTLALRSAEMQLLAGDPAAARERIAEVDDGMADVALLKARTAHALGETDEAHAQLGELQASPQPRVAREARLMAGRLGMLDGDLDGVARALNPLMESATPDPDAVFVWVEACRALERFDDACEPLERLLASPEVDAANHPRLHQMLASLYDRADRPDAAMRHLDQAAWVAAPHARVLAPQHGTGLIEQWLDHEWRAEEFEVPDDDLPPPVLLAGWPGAGRELIAAAIAADPSFRPLDPEGARRRREALDIPMPPSEAEGLPEATLHTGRRRFLRGFENSRAAGPVIDFGWWEATAIPVLARYFPELIVLMPEADERDLELYWRLSGYAAIDELRAAWRQEQALWAQVEAHLPLRIVRIPRGQLRDAPDRAVAAIRAALGQGAESTMLEGLQAASRRQSFPPEGRWAAYPGLFEADAGQ